MTARVASVVVSLALLGGVFGPVAWAQAPAPAVAQAMPAVSLPQPPEIAARSWLLIDLTASQALGERNADVRADPASLTKLMTAYLVFQALREGKVTLEQRLAVSERAWAERKGGGSLMFIDPKMSPSVDELLKGLIVQSGNDAAVALAEGVGGSVEGFVARMNQQAQAWGLKNTQFRNPIGLTEPGHHSSARDLSVIALHIIRDFPERYAAYYSMREYTFNKIRQDNRNPLLGRDPSVDGMKTGHTEAAGYCLIASAQREAPPLGKRRLLSVVLGTDSKAARATETQKLLEWGYSAYEAVALAPAGHALATVPVWKGKLSEVKLGSTGDLVVAVPRGGAAGLKTVIQRPDPLLAPLTQGQRVGSVRVTTAAGQLVTELPLVAQEAVPEAGWLGRTWDALRLKMK